MRYDALRAFLAKATQADLELIQFDVCTAFLNGDLEEEIFIKTPEGPAVEKSSRARSDHVCKLNKSVYGLKQAPRCWNRMFSEFLQKIYFTQGDEDQCIFKGCVDGVSVSLVLFVDDGLVASESSRVLNVTQLQFCM